MKRIVTVFSAVLLSLFGGCEKKRTGAVPAHPQVAAVRALTQPPEITSESETGFVDLIFYISQFSTEADGSRHLRAAGLHKGVPVGVEVVLGASWKSSSPEKGLQMSGGTVTYRSVGAESDAFIRVLDELYGTGVKPAKMAEQTSFAGLSLEGKPGDLGAGPVKVKCFYEAPKGKEDDGAEFYTNIDLAKQRLELHEKDEGYRASIVRALQGK